MPADKPMADAIVVADAHLEQGDQKLAQFLAFLDALQARPIHTLYILGDLFTIWFGTPKMQQPYHIAVVKALQTLQQKGIPIKYVEGNRDYFLAPFYLHAPFAEIAAESMQSLIGNKRMYFAHGDLVNVQDKQYRLWRNLSRNRAIYACFEVLPQSIALRLVHGLERALRETNRQHKAAFPAQTCENYARQLFQAGCDVIILGHFHEARQQAFCMNGQKKYLYVLPAWKDTQTYLQITDLGECSFQHFV